MNGTIQKALADQNELAETIRSDEPRSLALGKQDVVRQGDIYIMPLSKLPKNLRKRTSRQLADGDTQGSRHVLVGPADLFNADPMDMADLIAKEYPGVELREYQIGPVFKTDGAVTVEHPEHGHRTLTEPGCHVVIFQRSLDADGREERARD